MAKTREKRDQKLGSSVPRTLRVQIDRIANARLQACVFPVKGLYIKTRLRGSGTKHSLMKTPLLPPLMADLPCEHQVYEYNLTEGEMYTRVLEFAVHTINCIGHEELLGKATLPLSEFETNRLSGVMNKKLKLDNARVDLELHLSVELWNRHDVANISSRECCEFERFIPFVGWNKAHLRPDDGKQAFRSGHLVGGTLEDVAFPLPEGHIETLGWSAGPWFYAANFSGPWHNSNAGWRCRRRQLIQKCRREDLDTSIEVATRSSDGNTLKKMVEMVDLSIEEILQKHDVNLADY